MTIFAVVIVAVAGFLFGFDEGVISGASIYLRQEIPFGATAEGIMTSAVPLGALMAAILTSRITDRFGRKKSLILAGALFLAGSSMSALTPNLEFLIFARLILGWAIGVAAIVAPLYLSETAATGVRGVMIASYQLMVTIGILGAYSVNLGLAHLEDWRLMFACGLVPAAIMMLGSGFIPESPRWLAEKGREDEACAVLTRLRKGVPEADIQTEIDRVLASARLNRAEMASSTESWMKIFAPETRGAVVVAMGLFFLQQLSGINAVIYYAPEIFAGTGFEDVSSQLLATAGIGVINLLFTVVGMWLIDKAGRRSLLFIGFVGTAFGLALLSYSAFSLSGSAHAEGSLAATLAFAGIVIYIACFAIALGPIPYVIMSEIYPMRVRGAGMALASVANWGFNFMVVLLFPIFLATFGLGATFAVFSGICIFGVLFTARLVPETKGISLEAIEAHLHANKPLRDLGRS
jgi:SP family galactose:H+ symporter-like MFS transporter